MVKIQMKLSEMSDEMIDAIRIKTTLREVKDRYPGKWWNATEGFTFEQSGVEYTVFDYKLNDELIIVCYKHERCLHNDQRVLFAYKLKFDNEVFVKRVRDLILSLFRVDGEVTPMQLRIKNHLPICKNIIPLVEGGRFVETTNPNLFDVPPVKVVFEKINQPARMTSFAHNVDLMYRPRDPALKNILEDFDKALKNAPSGCGAAYQNSPGFFDGFYNTPNKEFVLNTIRARTILTDDGKTITMKCTRNNSKEVSFDDLIYYLKRIEEEW